MDQPHGLGGLEAKAFEVGWAVAADEALEGFLDALHVAGLEQRLGDVRPADAAFAGDLEDALQRDRRAELGESRRPSARRAVTRAARNCRTCCWKSAFGVVEEEAEDVDRDARQVGAELDAGDDAHAKLGANRWASARPSVESWSVSAIVGRRWRAPGAPPRRRESAVGDERVQVQVERQRA